MNPYRIVLADDHVMVRQGIRKIIEESDQIVIVGEANDGFELLDLLKTVTPDLVLLDISMPNLRGIEVTGEIRMAYPRVKILILTMHKDTEYVCHALVSGAHGYLLKEDTDTDLFSAIETIERGSIYVSRLVSDALIDGMLDVPYGTNFADHDSLTIREREVLKLIAEGKSSKESADLLCLSVRTVEHHRAKLMKKLNLKTFSDVVKYAIRKGFISVIT